MLNQIVPKFEVLVYVIGFYYIEPRKWNHPNQYKQRYFPIYICMSKDLYVHSCVFMYVVSVLGFVKNLLQSLVCMHLFVHNFQHLY